MIYSAAFLWGLCISCVASPLLTPEERNAIEVALNIAQSKKEPTKGGLTKGLHLSGILYSSEDKWTLWINEKTISSPATQGIPLENITVFIETLTADIVRLYFMKEGKKILFTLRANQSYLVEKDQIVEGHWNTVTPEAN